MNIEERNEILNSCQNIIWGTIHRNRLLIAALRLEEEDVFQDLVVAAIKAIDGFDPNRSESVFVHIRVKLQYAVLNMKATHRPHGMKIPQGEHLYFSAMDEPMENGCSYDIPYTEHFGECELSDALAQLTSIEKKVLRYKADGGYLQKKVHRNILLSAQTKVKQFYKDEDWLYTG